MSKKRVRGDLRVFGVMRDLGTGDEVALHEVLTWPTFGDMQRFADPQTKFSRTPWNMMTKKVVLGEQGATIAGGMTIDITDGGREEADSWFVKLDQDRQLPELRDGQVITMLDAKWEGGDGSAVWKLYGRTTGGTLTVSGDKLVIAGVPRANT